MTSHNVWSSKPPTGVNVPAWKLKANTPYTIKVTPVFTVGKKVYEGTAGNTSRVYTAVTEFDSKKALSGGIQLKWTKLKGKGDPRYKILVADNKDMEDAQFMTKKQSVTSVKINNLEKKKKYYVAIVPFIRVDDKVYYGRMSNIVKIKTN